MSAGVGIHADDERVGVRASTSSTSPPPARTCTATISTSSRPLSTGSGAGTEGSGHIDARPKCPRTPVGA